MDGLPMQYLKEQGQHAGEVCKHGVSFCYSFHAYNIASLDNIMHVSKANCLEVVPSMACGSHVYLGVENNACTGKMHIPMVTDQAWQFVSGLRLNVVTGDLALFRHHQGVHEDKKCAIRAHQHTGWSRRDCSCRTLSVQG